MDAFGLLVFSGAVLVACATPGPGVAALVARVLARGPQGAAAFSIGLALGDVLWLAVAVTGLSALAQAYAGVFVAIRYLGAAYLLFLAWRLWTSPVVSAGTDDPVAARESAPRLFLAGLAVTIGNPKVIVFYLALVPSLIDVTAVGPLAFAVLAATCFTVVAGVFAAYILLAARARRLLTSPAALRRVNRGMGGVMAGAAVAVATR